MARSEVTHSGPEYEAMAPAQCGCGDFVWQLTTSRRRSRQQSLYYEGLDRTSQLLIEALEFIRKLAMVDPQAMKNRGIKVAHVHGIFHDVVAVLVRFSVRDH